MKREPALQPKRNGFERPRIIPSSEPIPGRRTWSHGPIKILAIEGVTTAPGIKLEQERLAKLAAAEAEGNKDTILESDPVPSTKYSTMANSDIMSLTKISNTHQNPPTKEEFYARYGPFPGVEIAKAAEARAIANRNGLERRKRIPRVDDGQRRHHGGPIRIIAIDGVPTALGIRLEQEHLAKLAAEAAKESEGEEEAGCGFCRGRRQGSCLQVLPRKEMRSLL